MRRALTLLIVVFACSNSERPENAATAQHVEISTSRGAFTVELSSAAPKTTANFLTYVDAGAYDGAYFYRTTRPDNDPMINVIQGGLWRAFDEDGDEDFEPPFPPIEHEITEVTGLLHIDGAISMARVEPGTASSEFFISIGENPSLDFGGARNQDGQGFAVFGRVSENMEVIRAIHESETKEGEGFAGQLLVEPVEIISVKRVSSK